MCKWYGVLKYAWRHRRRVDIEERFLRPTTEGGRCGRVCCECMWEHRTAATHMLGTARLGWWWLDLLVVYGFRNCNRPAGRSRPRATRGRPLERARAPPTPEGARLLRGVHKCNERRYPSGRAA